MKKALMIVAIVAIVAIAGSMIYYFVFFRTGIAKEEIRLQEQKLQQEQEKEKKATVDSIANKHALNDCLKQAELIHNLAVGAAWENYQKSWDTEVKRLNSKDDTLPNNLADDLNKDRIDAISRADTQYESSKNDCFKLHGN
jgi:flagellar basal body-associated protein FliL